MEGSGADPPPPPPHYTVSSTSSSSATVEGGNGAGSGAHVAEAAASTAGPDNFFDIVPQSDATSFQAGYLGLEGFQSWIKGDVLVKLDEGARSNATSSAVGGAGGFDSCMISLTAVETGMLQSITLFSSTQTLWQSPNATSSSTSATTVASSQQTLPSTMPFSFPLTPDLPHCIHLGTSSLQYRLEAVLRSSKNPSITPLTRSVVVHLTRYSAPGPLNADGHAGVGNSDLEPHTWHVYTPTPMVLQLKRSLFRRAEPIDVRVKILPPERALMREKGLHLRSVEAKLLRVITRRDESYSGVTGGKHRSALASRDPSAENGGQSEDSESGGATSHESLLATSGKLCRFNTSRAIILRLSLHPPFDLSNMPHPHPDHDANVSGPVHGRGGGGGCESISQETLLHQVKFFVEIRVGIRGARGEDRSVLVKREVKILPGAAGGGQEEDGDNRHEKVKISREEQPTTSSMAGPSIANGVASRGERVGSSNSSSSRSSRRAMEGEDPFLGFDSEEEYDGYEDVGRSLQDGGDDVDVMDEATYRRLHDSGSGSNRNDAGHDTLEDHQRRLEQLRTLLEGPPPTLQESRHDVQVEVEVEGVGSAMPRSFDDVRRGHGATNFSSSLPYDADLHGYSAREETDANGESPPPLSPGDGGEVPWQDTNDEPPPPPISPFSGINDDRQRARRSRSSISSDSSDDPVVPGSYDVGNRASLPNGSFLRGNDNDHNVVSGRASTAFPPPYVAGDTSSNQDDSSTTDTSASSRRVNTSQALAFDLASASALTPQNDAIQPPPPPPPPPLAPPPPNVALRPPADHDAHPPAYPYTPPNEYSTYQNEEMQDGASPLQHSLHLRQFQHSPQSQQHRHPQLSNLSGSLGTLGPPSYEA